MSVAGEDGNAIAVLVLAGQPQCVFELVGPHDLEDRAEDLILITFHRRGHMVDQRRPDEQALLVPLQTEAATVAYDFTNFFLSSGAPFFTTGLVLACDDRERI